jgi:FtsP/CotA-like multicopper oxidase with cupredoxin domain
VVGNENEFVKMFDPPTESPQTPELLTPTNPVPEFMASLGLGIVTTPHTTASRLYQNLPHTAFDGVLINNFFTIADDDFPTPVGFSQFPARTLRVPRGVVFHGAARGAPSPHTIHWHGIEPTPLNDGVGHCSMEFGQYIFQWQPNFIGSYFYHCHRNTVQHFEFGLFGFLIIEPPDAYTSNNVNTGAAPVFQALAGGYPRRTAANLANFPQFPGFNGNPLTTPDPNGVFPTDPHAMTVPYDVEALWVIDDIDSAWHNTFAPGDHTTFPAMGSIPGVNDSFRLRTGGNGFFAFNNYNPDYFACTGVNFAGAVGGAGNAPIPANVVVPPAMNGGVTGMQVSINAKKGKTILIRALCSAYVPITITLPVDAVIIAFDGRALGVPPWNQYNHPFLLPAGTPYELTTARRFDALIRIDPAAADVNDVAKIHFTHNSGGKHLLNGTIPITIAGV